MSEIKKVINEARRVGPELVDRIFYVLRASGGELGDAIVRAIVLDASELTTDEIPDEEVPASVVPDMDEEPTLVRSEAPKAETRGDIAGDALALQLEKLQASMSLGFGLVGGSVAKLSSAVDSLAARTAELEADHEREALRTAEAGDGIVRARSKYESVPVMYERAKAAAEYEADLAKSRAAELAKDAVSSAQSFEPGDI